MGRADISRRRLLIGTATATPFLLAGCLGDDSEAADDDQSDDTDGGDEGSTDDAEDAIDASLPTDPEESDFEDYSGEELVDVITREGDDDEPDYVFDPPFIAVDPGTVVRWTNEDGSFHTVTSISDLDNRQNGGAVFDEDIADAGDEFEWTPESPGYQPYYCRPHLGFMWGSIAVLDDGAHPEPGTADDSEVDDADDSDADDETDEIDGTHIPAPLPTDPDEDDFVDETGQSTVEIITRQGGDGEPNFVFDQPFVRVDAGTTVRWENQDGVFHTITSTDSLENRSGGGDEFDSTISSVGDTFEWEADGSGRQDYYCSPHAGFMFGSIDVV